MSSERPHQRKVVVIDDDPDVRQMLRELLEAEGFAVESSGDGAEAVDRFRGGPPPHLFLVDLMMPGLSGCAVIQQLQADEALANVPMVVMTGGGPAMLATVPSADGYVRKPFDTDRLVELVHRACYDATGR